MRRIRIRAGTVQAEATLNDSPTADAIWAALPLQGQARIWGDEVYFPIPVILEEDNARETVELGDLGYWPPGNALCIFFGPTPMSRGSEIRPASAVNVFGHIEGDTVAFKQVRDGEWVAVESAEES